MIIPILLLLSLGIAVIYSSSQTLAIQQCGYAVVGLMFFLLLKNLDYRSFKELIRPAYIFITALLIITLILGIQTRGVVRWIPLGIFNFQPSEFAKPILILALAYFWSKNLPNWINIFKSLAIVLPILLLIFRQPDLGTTLTVFLIWSTLLFAANVSYFKILALSLAGLGLAPVSWFLLKDYQKQRLLSFISPNQDPKGVGFHVIQSTIAVGSGQFLGRGLGRGTQSRLQFLPEFRTDFIFAFIAEELGFVGSVIVLMLYTILFFLILKILTRTGDRFGELICIGVLGMFFFQILINIGMNAGFLPITGITLPLLSYGGSSLLTVLCCMGLLESVAKYGTQKKAVMTYELG